MYWTTWRYSSLRNLHENTNAQGIVFFIRISYYRQSITILLFKLSKLKCTAMSDCCIAVFEKKEQTIDLPLFTDNAHYMYLLGCLILFRCSLNSSKNIKQLEEVEGCSTFHFSKIWVTRQLSYKSWPLQAWPTKTISGEVLTSPFCPDAWLNARWCHLLLFETLSSSPINSWTSLLNCANKNLKPHGISFQWLCSVHFGCFMCRKYSSGLCNDTFVLNPLSMFKWTHAWVTSTRLHADVANF